MGNCVIKTPTVLDEDPGIMEAGDETTAGYDADADCGPPNCPPSPDGKRGRLKLKVVLTKAELEWLMQRLKYEKAGCGGGRVVEGAALEQALEKIRKGRQRDGVGEKPGRPWRPSLERIMEYPETQTLDGDCLHK